MRILSLACVGVFVGVVGCGGSVAPDDGSNSHPGPGTGADSGVGVDTAPTDDSGPTAETTPEDTAPVDTGPDHGAPSTTYPAFPPAYGVLANNGGTVLSAPVIVTVTWPGDDEADQLEAFGDALGATDYWKAVNAEYGAGPATSGPTNHVRLTETPLATMSDSDIDAYVADHAGNAAKYGWPAPTDQTIYVLYLAKGTSLNFGGGDACAMGVGGYHQSTTTTSGMEVAYAVIPPCNFFGGGTLINDRTSTASHELTEAATDPHPGSDAAWVGFENDSLAWDYFQQFQSENADSCEFYRDSFYRDTEGSAFSYEVQRSWSNASAKAGHNPCVPVPSGAYFGVTPLELEDVYVNLSALGGASKQKTRGIHIGVGETRTFAVGFFSDAATSGPWSIKISESNPLLGPPKTKRLTTSVDMTSGINGQQAYVTVTVNTAGTTKGELMTVTSTLGSTSHYMPILIGSM